MSEIKHLVFLPGMDGSGLLFQPLVDKLPHGFSPHVMAYPPKHFLDYPDLEAYVLPKLPVDAPYVIVAESFGGPLAVRIASHQPTGLRGLVLSATFVRPPRGLLGLAAKPLLGPYLFRKRLLSTIGPWLLKLQGLQKWQVELLIKALSHATPDILTKRLKAALSADVAARLHHCPVPVLCFSGKRDLLVPHQAGEDIKAANENVQIIELDTPHFLLQDQPDSALRLILKFINELNLRFKIFSSRPA